MTPEDMLAAIVSHSQLLDFSRPDPLIIAAREEKVGKKRCQNWRLLGRAVDEQVELLPAMPSALGKQSRSPSRHSIQEVAADALIGMHERNWQALQVAIGIGESARPLLASRLERTAYRIQQSERIWPEKLRRRRCRCGRTAAENYIPDLVEITIRHLEEPFKYRHQKKRAEEFGLGESSWHAVARRPFDQIAAHAWSWYYAGIGHIQQRIVQRGQRPAA